MRSLLSLYTGAGGLDLGFEAAGFETRAAVEMDPEAVATLRHNRPWPVIDRDIHAVSSEELLHRAGLAVGEADALIGVIVRKGREAGVATPASETMYALMKVMN